MNSALNREIMLVITWALLMLVLGLLFGYALIFLFLALLAYTIWNIYNLNRLTRWLSKPSKGTPETVGVWDEVYHQLYRLYQRQRKARKKLTSILNRFQQSTQALPDATIVLNDNDEIEWFNHAASVMFSLRTSNDIGQRIDNLIRQPEFANYLAKRKYEHALEFRNNNNKITLNITPYGTGQYLLSARDITLISRLDETRRDFISNASHELRTPVTVISGYVETMLERSDEANRVPLEKIQQQAIRMERIILEMLELSKLETQDYADEPTLVDVGMLLGEIHKEANELDRGEHVIESSAENVEIYGNKDELKMAFMNLVTNAIRYTPKGGLIKLFTLTDEGGHCFGVQDDGIGISYDHIPRLTERFYRVDEGRSKDVGGTGLGLAIVKHVLDRHHAKLYISSEPGKGSLFRCYFPKN